MERNCTPRIPNVVFQLPSPIERVLPPLNDLDQLSEGTGYLCANVNGVIVPLCICNKLIFIKDAIGKIRGDEYVNIEINEAQNISIELCGLIDVAIVVAQFACGFEETKDTEPAIRPIIFGAKGSRRNRAEEGMFDLFRENAFDDDERIGLRHQMCLPLTMNAIVKLSRLHRDGVTLARFVTCYIFKRHSTTPLLTCPDRIAERADVFDFHLT